VALKKQHFDPESEIPIFNDALAYVRDGHWQFRMALQSSIILKS
jgi:hypothetical protein